MSTFTTVYLHNNKNNRYFKLSLKCVFIGFQWCNIRVFSRNELYIKGALQVKNGHRWPSVGSRSSEVLSGTGSGVMWSDIPCVLC